MGDHNGREVSKAESQLFQRRGDTAAADACVDENMGISAGEEGAVACGGTGKGTKSHGKECLSLSIKKSG
jgi:hypothetical protein